MTPTPTRLVTRSAVEHTDVREWREEVLREVDSGARVVTLFGRSESEGTVRLTAVLETGAAGLRVLRTVVDRERGYHALTEALPALHVFERELHEQHGVRVAGHPWLKPVRFEHGRGPSMDAYPWHRVEGRDVHEVAVGPIHAGVIEPGSFRFMCHGEDVLHLEIHLGYQHRGVERLLLERPLRHLPQLVETIAGDSSVAYGWAHAAAVELLAGLEPSEPTELSRALMLELERIAMHLASLSGLATDIGFLQAATTWGRLRTTAINTSMRLCGSRFGRSAVRPASNPIAMDAERRELLRTSVDRLVTDLAPINDRFLSDATVRQRLVDVGVVPTATARAIGLVGPAGRASGVAIDHRSEGAYHRFPVASVVEEAGDVAARARVRIREMDASLAWIRAVTEAAPDWPRTRVEPRTPAPGQVAVAVVEGWRGEVVHVVETDARHGLLHYKVQDPSLRNWFGLALAVRGEGISDFPICNKSFDLSYCGNDL